MGMQVVVHSCQNDSFELFEKCVIPSDMLIAFCSKVSTVNVSQLLAYRPRSYILVFVLGIVFFHISVYFFLIYEIILFLMDFEEVVGRGGEVERR